MDHLARARHGERTVHEKSQRNQLRPPFAEALEERDPTNPSFLSVHRSESSGGFFPACDLFSRECSLKKGSSRGDLWENVALSAEADRAFRWPIPPPAGPLRQGDAFLAQDFKDVIRLRQTSHVFTSPDYPQSHRKLEGRAEAFWKTRNEKLEAVRERRGQKRRQATLLLVSNPACAKMNTRKEMCPPGG
jgi:hypothetical protein